MAREAPTFRRAVADDLPAIIALLADDVLGSTREDATLPPRPCYVQAFEAIDRDPLHQLVVAEREGHIVGCLQLTFIPGLSQRGRWRAQIESVRIAASARGTGLGRVMFDWAIARCREHGCGVVQLTTDKQRTDARRFYESLGFVASHEGMKLNLD
ncbi:acetyltransferase [Bordetella ansorpii]|uniref:Acetyltransferase n=1 Tax=Bordetella ansorpii TaxID=288768 RepID=A0A157SLE9_9BORD|nr:GNAT family N-acetyltransferase [Bordetella ansorpii]SAI71101.1 acetyltransferase [Bordetella ansorpii]